MPNDIYTFFKENDLTKKSEKDFLNEYSDKNKAEDLYDFMVQNNLTQKKFDNFYDEYLKKKDSIPVSSGEEGVLPSDGEKKPEKPPEGFRTFNPEDITLEEPKYIEVFKVSSDKEIIDKQKKQAEEREKRKKGYLDFIDKTLPDVQNEYEKYSNEFESNQDEFKRLYLKGSRRSSDEEEQFRKLDKLVEESYNKATALGSTIDLLNQSKRYIETSDKGILKSMAKSKPLVSFLTLGLDEVTKDFDVLETAKKFQKGETLSKAEQQKLFAYGLNQLIQEDVEKTVGSMIGSGVVESIPYMIQFALSGPTSTAGKEIAVKAVESTLNKLTESTLTKIATRALGEVTQAGIRAFMLSDFYSGLAQRQIGQIKPTIDKEGNLKGIPREETQLTPWQATKRSYASTYVTAAVENFGKTFDSVFNKIAGKIPNTPMINKISNSTINQVKNAVGFQSWLGEFSEEILEAYGQAAVTGDQKLSDVWDNKQMLATAGAVAIMAGGFSGSNLIIKGQVNDQADAISFLRSVEESIGSKRAAEIDRILKGDDLEVNASQLDTYIKDQKSKGASKEEIKNIIDYYGATLAVNSMNDTQTDIQNTVTKGAVSEVNKEGVKETTPPKPELAEESKTATEKGITEKAPVTEAKPLEEDLKGKVIDRPEMENPVHRIVVGGEEKFLQRQEGMTPGQAAWFEVQKDEKGNWNTIGGEDLTNPPVGDTKAEAVTNLKSKADENEKKLSEQGRKEKGNENVKEKTYAKIDEGEKNEILTSPKYSELVNIAEESKTPEEFNKKFSEAKLPADVQQKFFDTYQVGEETTRSLAGKQLMSDLEEFKKKQNAKEQQGRPVREQGPGEGQIEGVSDKDLSGIYRAKLQDRQKEQKESIKKIGDISKKTPVQMIDNAQSVHELDYLLSTNQIKFNKDYQEKKADLLKENKIDDIDNRIPLIEQQRSAIAESSFQQAIEEELGKDRVEMLRDKRGELLDSVSNRLGKIANLKFAVGEEGKVPDVIKELAGVIKDLAELGIVNLELGARQAIDKLKKYIGDQNPDAVKVVDDNYENLLAEVEMQVPKKQVPKKAKEKEKFEKPAEQRPPAELLKQISEAEQRAAEKLRPDVRKERAKWFRKLFVDKTEPFKVELIKEDPDLGRRAVDYFNLQNGVSGQNNIEFNRARAKILGEWGKTLSQGEQKALERYIMLNRVVELDKLYDKRGEERINHPEGINKEEAESIIKEMFNNNPEILKEFGLEKLDMETIVDRADNYYQVMQDNLKKLYDAGIINAQVYKKLSEEQPYYSRRQYLDTFIDGVDGGGSISGLDALSGGSFGALLTDLQTLLADNIARTNYAISRTKTFNALKDYALANPESEIIKVAGVTPQYFEKLREENEKPEEEREYIEPKWEDTPNGFTALTFKENGLNTRIYRNNEFVNELKMPGNPEWLSRVTNALSWISGTKILKMFATGYNPEFMVKNIPLDMLHILTTTEYYSPVYPVATAQMLKDIKTVLPDVLKRKGRYNDYVQEGGSMDFLTTQGSLTPKKFKYYNKFTQGTEALLNAAEYLGNTSELLTRLALRERVINNLTSDFKKKNGRDPNKNELKEINTRATAAARNYLDFSQGGHAVKLANSVIPYLNAGFQVTRGTLRAASRNPKVFALKLAQLGGTATAIMAYNLGMYSGGDDEKKEERKNYFLNDISDRIKADNFIIMTPYSFYDKNGNKRYVYFKFPKDNSIKPITGIFEGSLMKSVGIKNGLLNKQRVLEVQSLFQNFADLGNLPPIARGSLGYQLNTDLYFKQPLWTGKDFGKNKALEYTPGKTPARFIRFGEITGLSPVRSQYFAQQFTTRSNVLGSILGEGLDFAAAGFDKEIQETLDKNAGEFLTTAPFSRRFFKTTFPYAKGSDAKTAQQEYNRKKQEYENTLKKMINQKKSEAEIVNWIVNIEDPNESNRIMNRYISGIQKGDVDYRVKELSYISPKPRANQFYKFYKEADDKGKDRLIKQSLLLGGVISRGEFAEELKNLLAQDSELNLEEIMDRIDIESEKLQETRQPRYEKIMDIIEKAEAEKEKNE
jgi:hypothetical protein